MIHLRIPDLKYINSGIAQTLSKNLLLIFKFSFWKLIYQVSHYY